MLRSPTPNSKFWPPFQGAREASWPTEDKQRHLSDSLVSCIGDSSVLSPMACVYMTLTPDLQFQGWAQVVRLLLSLLLLLLIFYFLYYGCKWPFSLQKLEIRKYRLNGTFPLEWGLWQPAGGPVPTPDGSQVGYPLLSRVCGQPLPPPPTPCIPVLASPDPEASTSPGFMAATKFHACCSWSHPGGLQLLNALAACPQSLGAFPATPAFKS